eukprot:tig00000654_g2804.t1
MAFIAALPAVLVGSAPAATACAVSPRCPPANAPLGEHRRVGALALPPSGSLFGRAFAPATARREFFGATVSRAPAAPRPQIAFSVRADVEELPKGQRENLAHLARHNSGVWHGRWTVYAPDGRVTKAFDLSREVLLEGPPEAGRFGEAASHVERHRRAASILI